jgi:transcriptional regulator with XRE-family HTH domain
MEKDFGKNFKEYRKLSRMTQKQVADKLGIHQSNVSDWENNVSRPEYENLIELAKIYEVSICDLLDVNDQK